MNRFVKSLWFKILIIIFVLLLVFIIIGAATAGRGSPLSGIFGTITQPLSRVTSSVGRGFTKVSEFFTSSQKYEDEIKGLQGQIADYQAQLADYEQTKQRLALYEEFLDVKEENPDYKVVPAVVIGRDSSSAFDTFVFNKGASHGVKVNDPVIYGKGQLVGVVSKVFQTYCVVSTILDPNVSVSAYEVRTREAGFVSNNASLAKEGVCRLSGLERTTSIAPGGIVCTTGVGGIYPRDLIIGTVKEVKNDSHDISSYAIIESGVDIENLEDALILIGFDGEGTVGTPEQASSKQASPEQ